ncbi:hypothetical protein ALO83_100967 [Pseudomonas cannabina pv. alisalensis]|uniref:Uncharacterized protein n=1 Tax=Pseudomonas cannabina TaxID=86840 RepID=A0AB37QDK6_PSECA|nr:hypothetical protein ALO83_100967 [Pseudomonas cannabina pv. alisalensis]RMN81397.1 hypothetical protein ALQ52_101178 [Pseudomonas cannabina pv. alisalensis]RMN83673.1 hypothetical protein ALQ53_100911 [Pseudomonas cannabina]
MKPRISAWRGVSLIMRGALAFYTVTGIIYSEGALAIIHFSFAAEWLLASRSTRV